MEELLNITELSVEYRTGEGTAKAVNGLNLAICKGEALGLVGESGAGKTTTALSILNLLPEKVGVVTGGDILFHGESICAMKEKKLNTLRGNKIAMIFSNPLTSLNPVFTVGDQISMILQRHKGMTKKQAHNESAKFLRLVGIPDYRLGDFPHQFSGGMRQRVGIAAALACSPELLIADEPTTALDVTIQAQILELIRNLQKESGMSLLMITHNLGIIAELCQKVAVMYGGEIIEFGTVEEVFRNPAHPYTIGLWNAIPRLKGTRNELESIPGHVANSKLLPDGCKFHERCAHCTQRCRTQGPPMTALTENHSVACWEMGKKHE